MFEFTSLESELTGELHKEDIIDVKSIMVENIQFGYPGHKSLISDLSFQVNKGEIISLSGEIGSGKSTILQIIQRFYKIEAGNIFVNYENWNRISNKNWRQLIGVVPQNIDFFTGTLLDNIGLGLSDNNAIINFCQENGFHTFFENLPHSYLTLLGENGIKLSGGQKQLIGLARALFHKPQVLLLDEPTAAMDKNTERFVVEILNKNKLKLLTILITHNSNSLIYIDRTYYIKSSL